MTDRQAEALAFCWATELAMTQQPVTLSVTEAREVSAEMQRLHAENTALQQGNAAARLEIQSLQARIKTMAEEHADELMVAHLDGRMRVAQPAGAQQPGVATWTPLPGTLPEPGKPVLLDIGVEYPIRAMWAAKHALEVGMEDDSGFGEYDEATDTYYCPEGWYEWNEHEETHWAVDETPTAWCELPPNGDASHGQAPAQAAPAAVAVPTFEDFCKRHGLDPKKMDGHGGMWARVALDECRAITTQPDPQQEAQEPVMIYHGDCTIDCGEHGHHHVELLRMIPAGSKLYTAPQPLPASQGDALDAARYRWLRQEHERVDPVCHLTWKRNLQRDSSEWVNTAVLDTAIDAARKQGANHD